MKQQPASAPSTHPHPSQPESATALLAGDDVVARAARRFRAVSEPTRIRILELLARRVLSVGEVAAALRVCASVASRHLAVLADAHWVIRAREGATVLYKVTPATAAQLAELLDANADELTLNQPPPHDPFDIASHDPETVAYWVDMGSASTVPLDNEYEWNHHLRSLFGDDIVPHLAMIRDACIRFNRGEPDHQINLPPAVMDFIRAERTPSEES
ncbi:MAG TPA: metalloregulator ArsR/SmtB family transcription factor [Longimicrobiales bacterium]|nr:metalloregulator ArsR/SmtB family transcription factor [Longimicrobiales bacterium]